MGHGSPRVDGNAHIGLVGISNWKPQTVTGFFDPKRQRTEMGLDKGQQA